MTAIFPLPAVLDGISDGLAAVARDEAEAGRAWIAIAAQCSSDMVAVSEALRETDLHVTDALLTAGVVSSTAETARDIVESSRTVMLRCVVDGDGNPAALPGIRLADLDYLTNLAAPAAEEVTAFRDARLSGLSPYDFKRERVAYARAMSNAARGFVADGSLADGFRALYRADLALFEAHCADLSERSGDWSFVTLEVRFRLACRRLGEISGALGDDIVHAAEMVREALDWSTFQDEELPRPRWLFSFAE